MSIGNQVIQVAITSLVNLIGHGEVFSRIKAEIQRVNEQMPDATGADKRAQFLADFKIIFDDLVVPISGSVLNLLIELGVAYLKAQI
jgi:hypothetical protein